MVERDKVIVVQPDKTILVDTHHPQFEEVRKKLISFSELIKTPEHMYFYRITPISLWNSAANGVPLDEILETLQRYKKYDIPENVIDFIRKHYTTYGKVVFQKYDKDRILIKFFDEEIKEKVEKLLEKYILEKLPDSILVSSENRGVIKTELIKHLIPVKDLAGFDAGNKIEIELRNITLENKEFKLRYYQSEAVYNFSKWKEGSGIIVLPCGAGKTIVAIGIIADIKEYTLIITTSNESVKQWKKELLDKTTLRPEDIGEYTSQSKNLTPITITTYSMLIHKRGKSDDMRNINIFTTQNWGLIVYDEVHILPAPIFRMTTSIQSKRRLGLTATLVREDNLESEVFTLIGPKIYEFPWKLLEKEGWIAKAFCYEIKIALPDKIYSKYLNANQRSKFRIASTNPEKIKAIEFLLEKHKSNHILIIGHFLSQLQEVSRLFNLPLITGETLAVERQKLYEAFREGKIKALCISRVGNFSIDLPLADVAIQISGIFGSRQEEAQRLGRILRPDSGNAFFYTLISKNTLEEDFARKRQLFLLEQGYKYEIVEFSDLIKGKTVSNNEGDIYNYINKIS